MITMPNLLWRSIMRKPLPNNPRLCAERFPFKYMDHGILENGCGDFRMMLFNEDTQRYKECYLFDNKEQMMLAIEDHDYSRWLTGMSCYVRDTVKKPTY